MLKTPIILYYNSSNKFLSLNSNQGTLSNLIYNSSTAKTQMAKTNGT